MARNGSGVYSLPSGQPVVTGTTISSTTFNTLTTDLANALTTSIASDGQTAMSANLPMGGNKIFNLSAGTIAGDSARFEQVGALALLQGAAASGSNNDISNLLSLSSINGGQLGGLRNRITNSNFAVNQRSVSGTVTLAAGSYGHDRFKAGTGGCTYTFAASGNGMMLTITAGTLLQIIEGANLEGGAMKLSWVGTATGRVDSGAYGASGVVGTAVAATNQTVEFGTGTLSKVQYELGTVATTFEQRPVGLELALCQRCYEEGKTQFGGAYPTGGVSAQIQGEVVFKVTKRATATMSQLASSSSVNVSANTFQLPTPSSVGVVVTQGGAAGNFSLYLAWSASADL